MDRALQYVLSEQSYLYEALRVLRLARATGVLRVVAEQVNGRIAVRDGQPCAAHNGTTGGAGDTAIREIRKAGVGIYHFSPAQLPAEFSGYALSQRFSEHLEEMAERLRIKQFDEMYQEFVWRLPATEQELLNKYRQLGKEEDRAEFLEQNPEFLQHGSLNEQKLKVIRLYGQLNNEIDKRAFLKANPRFHEIMMDVSGLSDEQRKELEGAQYAGVEMTPEFAKFCRQLFGKTYPSLSEEQALMLKGNFLRLATAENRRVFASVNPLLNEDAPVLRGESVLPFVRVDDPAPEVNELTEEERLAAMQLQAIDYVEKGTAPTEPYLRLKDIQTMKVTIVERKKPVTSALVLSGVAMIVVFIYVFTQVRTGINQKQTESSGPNSVHTEKSPFLVTPDDDKPPVVSGSSSNAAAPSVSVTTEADIDAAEKLVAAGHADQALGALESYVERNPSSVRASTSLVRCYIATNKKKKARMLCISIFKNLHLSNQDNYALTQLWRESMR